MYEIQGIEILNDDTNSVIHSEKCKIMIDKKDEKALKLSIKNNYKKGEIENISVLFYKREVK
jgi:hypothetical protein